MQIDNIPTSTSSPNKEKEWLEYLELKPAPEGMVAKGLGIGDMTIAMAVMKGVPYDSLLQQFPTLEQQQINACLQYGRYVLLKIGEEDDIC